jgi:hypothetical protein
MPPRYAYWTLLIGSEPTAFRSATQEDLLPTMKRLQQRHEDVSMKWFQNGKLWESRVEAQESMRERGDRGRMGDSRQSGFRDRQRAFRDPARDASAAGERKPRRDRADWNSKPQAQGPNPQEKLEWKPKGEFTPPPPRGRSDPSDRADSSDSGDRPAWKPKGAPRPKTSDRPARSFDRDRKPDWKPKGTFDRDRKPDWKSKSGFDRSAKPDWKPKSGFDRGAKPDWKSKGTFDRERKPDWRPKTGLDRGAKPDWKPKSGFDRAAKPDWKPKSTFDRDRKPAGRSAPSSARDRERPEWAPKSQAPSPKPPVGKRKWVPKEEYKKSKGIERPRDSKWRPGGEHRDPKQKYKDAKKAKWTKFKANIRQRRGGGAPRKKDDE